MQPRETQTILSSYHMNTASSTCFVVISHFQVGKLENTAALHGNIVCPRNKSYQLALKLQSIKNTEMNGIAENEANRFYLRRVSRKSMGRLLSKDSQYHGMALILCSFSCLRDLDSPGLVEKATNAAVLLFWLHATVTPSSILGINRVHLGINRVHECQCNLSQRTSSRCR